jgi:hypothetical protein
VASPPSIKKKTWITSVYPITFIPPRVITIAKMARPLIQTQKSRPEIVLTASAPRKSIEVRFTITYNNNQNTAMMVLTVVL